MGTREPNEASQVVVNPEWEKLGPAADIHFCEPGPVLNIDPPSQTGVGHLNDVAAGLVPVTPREGWRPIIFKRPDVCPSTVIKSLRRKIRILQEELVEAKADGWFYQVLSIVFPVPRVTARIRKAHEMVFRVDLLPDKTIASARSLAFKLLREDIENSVK